MNIKEAKTEIMRTIRIYTQKDSQGHYLLPAARQRPVLLIGPPGIGKTAIMEQIASEYPPECSRASCDQPPDLSESGIFGYRVHYE